MLPIAQLDAKVCRKCGESKPRSDFHFGQCKSCKYSYCKEWRIKNKARDRANARRWYIQNIDKVKANSRKFELMDKFGITKNEYNRLFQIQGGMCKICGIHQNLINKSLRVDHCHKTKQIRGLLCHNCNVSLGLMKESISSILRMAEYLVGK